MSELRIERAELPQLGDLLPLFGAYLHFYQRHASTERCEAFLRARIASSEALLLMAWQGAHAVGFALVYPGYSSLSMAPSHCLNDLFVTPAARRCGVASALLTAVRKQAATCGAIEVTLQTARDNSAAQALYRAHGFQPDDEFQTYALSIACAARTG